MKLRKGLFVLTALVALIGSSLAMLSTSGAARQIETSITVLDTGCVDDPTSLSLNVTMNPTWDPDTASPGAWIGSTSSTNHARLVMDVNECVLGWSVSASMTDFISPEGNVISTPDHFYLRVNTHNGKALYPGQSCIPQFGCFSSELEHTGTWGPAGNVSGPGAYGSDVRFGGNGPVYSALSTHPILSGNETAVGPIIGVWGVRWGGIENITDTPPGVYTAEMTMTYTPVNP
ncbi:MAG TPA: hypothetical protein VKZ61_01220 [Thermomicrobiales bacterium]|nr:hypothetical protein [Thermomicrobiales bacterium]